MARLQWHKLNPAMFPKKTQDLFAKRASVVKQLQAVNDELDKDISSFAGRISVPVMLDSGKVTSFGNPKMVAHPTEKETLPRTGETLVIGFRYGLAIASASPKEAAQHKTEATLV